MVKRHSARPSILACSAAAVLVLGAASPFSAFAQDPASITGPYADTAAHSYRPGIDVLDYEIALDLPDTGRSIEGRATLRVRRTARVDTLVLDLISLRVDSVIVDGESVRFRRGASTIAIPLPACGGMSRAERRIASVYCVGDTLSVVVRYGGVVADGLIVSTDAAGRWLAFGDNWPDRARNWIPSVDHPSDKATVTWTVRAPASRTVVANGQLLDVTPAPAFAPMSADASSGTPRLVTRWRETRPIPVYLMVIAAAPLVAYDLGRAACGHAEQGSCVEQQVYVAPEVRDFLPGPFTHATEIVDFFSTLVAPFPYEKLAHLESATRFGGMENASAIFYADRPFRDRTMGAGVIAHETAHQWFGDAVTEREWGHVWLSEGFASYWEKLWVQRFTSDSAFRDGMRQLRREIIESPVTAARPVLDTAETDYLKLLNTNSYQKGAWVLHMLRSELGDSAFFRGVRAYYTKHRHGTALTDDLRQELEAASGRPLGAFFDQWLRRPGVPRVQVTADYDVRAKRVVLRVEQEGTPYRFPLTVEVRDSDGRRRRATIDVPATASSRIAAPALGARRVGAGELVVDPDVTLLADVKTR